MAELTEVMLAARKVEGTWEMALISKGRFLRAVSNDDLFKLCSAQLAGFLVSDRPDGTEVTIRVGVTDGEEPKTEDKNATN